MQKSNILVSILCTTYNHEKYIDDALSSFISQKVNFEFEILIHDDASTDNTASIIKSYETKYPTLIKPIYQKENQYSQGIKPTFKFNIPRSKGKYIAFCEGDDYWTDPHKLQKQVDFLRENKEYSICSTKIYTGDGQFKKRRRSPYVRNEGKFLLYKNFIPTAASIIRKSSLPKNYPEWLFKTPLGDLSIFYLSSKNGKIKILNDYTAYRRLHSSGVWSTRSNNQLTDAGIQFRKIVQPHISENEIPYLRAGIARLELKKIIFDKLEGANINFKKHLLENSYRSTRHKIIHSLIKIISSKKALILLSKIL